MCGILIVDDDASIRFAMADYFAAKGLKAESVASLEAAQARLAAGHIGIVITDLRLTPFDDAEGLQVVRLVAERHAGTVCIVLTAYGSRDSEVAARRHGACAFLHKPQPMGELLDIVTKLLPAAAPCPVEAGHGDGTAQAVSTP